MSELMVKIKPVLDKSAARRMGTTLGRTSGGVGGGVDRKLFGADGFGGLLKTAAVATAGIAAIALGVGAMVKRLAEASPMLSGIMQMFRNAINLFLMPIGNAIALHLAPMARAMIQLAMEFNRTFTTQGWQRAFDNLYKDVMSGFADLIGVTRALDAMFASIGRSLDGMSRFANTAYTDIIRLLTDAKNAIIGLPGRIRDAITGAMPRVSVPSVPSGGDIIGRLRGLVPFASGGIVTGPTPALVGEAGPEAIIPLDRMGEMMSGVTVVFNGDVYGMADFEAKVRQAVARASRGSRYA